MKVTSLPDVMDRSSPSCDFSMLVIGDENEMACVASRVLRSHQLSASRQLSHGLVQGFKNTDRTI